MLSIIIPTLNEEKYLPQLLESIEKQSFDNYEVIVADANSEDKTREIAREFGAKVVEGGFQSKGRNRGVEAAQGDLLLFVDADVVLPEKFLNKTLREFEERNLDGSSFFIHPATKNSLYNLLFDFFYNYPISFLSRIWPHGSMAIMAKKDVHQEIEGFDEEIVLLEDLDYVRKIAKMGKYRIQKESSIFASVRRFRKNGWAKTYLKLVAADFYMTFDGSIKTDIFNYDFDHES